MTTPDNIEVTEKLNGAASDGAPGEKADIGEAPPQKRGRGRPPKNKDAASVQAQINATASKEAPKAAKAKKAASAAIELDAGKLGAQIQGLHIIIAKFTGMPFMMLSEKEAVALGESICGVASQYDLTINPKVAAGLQLALTGAMIYGPRAVMFAEAKKQAIQKSRMMQTTGNADDVSSNTTG